MIEPLLDNVLIEPVEAEKKTTSGIILPEKEKEAPQIGIILAIGPKCEFESYNQKLKKGKKAVYKKWMGNEVKLEGKKYILINEKDVLGVIK